MSGQRMQGGSTIKATSTINVSNNNTNETKIFLNLVDEISIAKDLKKYFNMVHGVAFVKKYNSYVDIYNFTSNVNHITSIHSNVFQRFIFYFKEQAHPIIQNYQFEKLIVPMTTFSDAKQNNFDEKHGQFLKSSPIKRFYLDGVFEGKYLTLREIECLNWCLKGKTAEETAFLLGISRKTVENHLQQIKQKLNCYKKMQLIKTAIQLGIYDEENTYQ